MIKIIMLTTIRLYSKLKIGYIPRVYLSNNKITS
ncbi:MAG: hypothetical protein K0R84_2659 [Clostridia bacterium]|jgi:hypothetical protein|nr:hypothetical protein [Clostridia bacterium]